ncbi:hypothetical protein [Conyzicola sp.]|uniref:hypothetical protein n=1 Tax=Conyzicola sp. TaxID=1969404 RepID=UPI00398A25DB
MPKTSTRTRLGIGSATLVAAVAALAFVGPASAAQAYGTSPDELTAACENGYGDVGVSVKCTFEVDHTAGYYKQWHRYGSAVTNCNTNSPEIKQTILESKTLSETWTVGAKFGFSYEGVGIEGNSSYSQTTSKTDGVNRELTALPNEKVAATIGTEMAIEEGRMRVEIFDNGGYQDGSTFASPDTYYIDGVKREVPTGVTEHGEEQVACDQKFTVDPEN